MVAQTDGPSRDGGSDEHSSSTSPIDAGILEFSIGYPGRNGISPVLIGGVLGLASVFVLPLFIMAGYFVRLTRRAGTGHTDPPEFDDWSGMLVDGLGLIIMLLPVLVVYWLIGLVAVEIHPLAYLLVIMVLFYPLPALYLNYAMHDDWRSTYRLSRVKTYVTSKPYFVGALAYLFVINGIGTIFVMILFGLSLLTLVGWIILWPMIWFYWYGIDAALWGWVHNRVVTT
jgi:hypothetical protein